MAKTTTAELTLIKFLAEKEAREHLEKFGNDVKDVVFSGVKKNLERGSNEVKVNAIIAVEIFNAIIDAAIFDLAPAKVIDYMLKKRGTVPQVYAAVPADVYFDLIRGAEIRRYEREASYPGLLSMDKALKAFFLVCKTQMDEREFHELVLNIICVFTDELCEREGRGYFGVYHDALAEVTRDALRY